MFFGNKTRGGQGRALNGKKSYEFFKIEKSLNIFNKIFKSFELRFKLVV